MLLVGLASTLFSFAQFFVDLFVEPISFGDVFLFQMLLKPLHFLYFNLNRKGFEFFASVSEVLSSVSLWHMFTSLVAHDHHNMAVHNLSREKFGPRLNARGTFMLSSQAVLGKGSVLLDEEADR